METQQRTIYINSQTGSDSDPSSGTKEKPLASYAEYDRRKQAGAYPFQHGISISGSVNMQPFRPAPNRKERRAAEKKARRAAASHR